MTTKDCNYCANCVMRNRFEAVFNSALKDHPGLRNWINGQKRENKKHLVCFRVMEDHEAEARSVCYGDVA